MASTPSATAADPLRTALHRAAQTCDDAAISKPFDGWRWAKRAVWLAYVPPLEPPSDGDPMSSH